MTWVPQRDKKFDDVSKEPSIQWLAIQAFIPTNSQDQTMKTPTIFHCHSSFSLNIKAVKFNQET